MPKEKASVITAHCFTVLFYFKKVLAIMLLLLTASCGVIERTSRHGFESGYYRMSGNGTAAQQVYVHLRQDSLFAFPVTGAGLQSMPVAVLPLTHCSEGLKRPVSFRKQSMDIDLTSVVFKYRPARSPLPAQFTTDLNAALYAGWRFDAYTIRPVNDALQRCTPELISRGFDFGLLLGGGATHLTAYNTGNAIDFEYNGLVLQYGLAFFLESSFASFGVAGGFDYLTGPHRKVWLYRDKPWVGFVVGIALK